MISAPFDRIIGTASYPRLNQLHNGSWIACGGQPAAGGGGKALVTFVTAGPDPLSAWTQGGAIVESSESGEDLANCFVLSLGPQLLVAAYRHHTGRFDNGTYSQYRIMSKRSNDGGVTWSNATFVFSSPILGAWEPFLWKSKSGIFCAFSLELSPHWASSPQHIEQDIVLSVSVDGGAKWSAPRTAYHTPGSRNGMPSVARLVDGSLVLAFEGFYNATRGWGAFTVQLGRSFDDGLTWQRASMVYEPQRDGRKSGAPYVAVSAVSDNNNSGGRVVVSFMTDENVAVPARNYVANCTAKALVSVNNGAGGASLKWPSSAHQFAGFQSMWPSVIACGYADDEADAGECGPFGVIGSWNTKDGALARVTPILETA